MSELVGEDGTWRVYYNSAAAFPLSWCVAPDVDDDGWELAVASVSITAPAETVCELKATPDDEDGKPSAWFRVVGRLVVDLAGHATIEPS